VIPKLTGFPARYWWVLLVSGILALIAGLIVLVWPGRTLLLLTVVAAFWLIFYAAMLLVSAVMVHGPTSDRLLRASLALLSGIAGALILARPGQGLLAVALAFGIYLIASGLLAFVHAGMLREGRGWNIFRGVIDVAAGLIAVVWPDISLLVLATLLWIWLVLSGCMQIAGALALRRLEKEQGHDVVVPGPPEVPAAPEPPVAPTA
jgi:uncharacterized membrane protein HdeD (DUF308 family)